MAGELRYLWKLALLVAAVIRGNSHKTLSVDKAIEKVKSTTGKAFLDKAGEEHLWKAATHMRPRDSYAGTPPLQVGDEEIEKNEEEISWAPVTKREVLKAVKRTKENKAPGEGVPPILVWKHLWSYLGETIARLFTASLEKGYYPKRLKQAMIIVLRKPGKQANRFLALTDHLAV
ncbi:hypothetical protein CNMCM8980_004911 [Aspergillus fumigatiaffinis]|nr:hypothetical protein CNMCM8980_004911 [Aspergillus fumigatiaffinis]